VIHRLLISLWGGTKNTRGEWRELRTCCVGGRSVRLLSGAQRGGRHLVLPWEFTGGPQEAGVSAGRGSLTPAGVEDSFYGSVQAFRIPSRRVAPYLVTVSAAR